MPKQSIIEARVVAAVEHVLAGGAIEDDRIECKGVLMPPDQVRQLAGAANAALGDDILWIVGLDEKGKKLVPIDPRVDLANWWAKVERNFDDGVAPLLSSLRVPVSAGFVLALHFSTDRAPYLVKAIGGGSPEREVPWREGSRTRSAKRHELLRLLLPLVTVPDVVVIRCSGEITSDSNNVLRFLGEIEFYVETTLDSIVAIPTHLMSGAITIFQQSYTLDVSPAHNLLDTGSREVRRDGLYCSGPGTCVLVFAGPLGPVEGDTPDRLRDLTDATLEVTAGVVGGSRPIRFNEQLLSLYDRDNGPTMRVPMRSYARE